MGVLETIEHFFEELEEALAFAETAPAHAVKVYNDGEELVHSTSILYTEPIVSYSGADDFDDEDYDSYSGVDSTYA